MEIKKKSDSYDTYSAVLSMAELRAIRTALHQTAGDIIADELGASIDWFLTHLPAPGEEKEKASEKPVVDVEEVSELPDPSGAPTSMDSPDEASPLPAEMDLDMLLPEP